MWYDFCIFVYNSIKASLSTELQSSLIIRWGIILLETIRFIFDSWEMIVWIFSSVLQTCRVSSNSITCKPGSWLVVVYIDASHGVWVRVGVCAKIAFRSSLRIKANDIWSRTASTRGADDAADRVHFALCTRDMMWFSKRFYMRDAFVSLNLFRRSFIDSVMSIWIFRNGFNGFSHWFTRENKNKQMQT